MTNSTSASSPRVTDPGPANLDTDRAADAPATGQRSWARGLVTLSSVELWERFSFYGLQVILVYYLYYTVSEGGLGIPQTVALGIAGSYGALVYISQIIGAWIADRLAGPRYVVLAGAIAIMAGHIALALLPQIPGLVAGLALIVIGTGGLKVNTTSMVGSLYPEGGPRRDAGYSVYYMGISIGAFVGPLITGALQTSMGFHIAFGAAAVGMAIGLVQYVIGMRRLPTVTRQAANPLPREHRLRWVVISVVAVIVIAALVISGFVNAENISNAVTVVIVVAIIGYFVTLLTSKHVTGGERKVVRYYIPVFFLALLFWTLLFQLFTSLTVYVDTRVDLDLFGYAVPPAWVITAQGLLVTLIVPLLGLAWTRGWAARIKSETKLVAGCLVMAVATLPLVANANTPGQTTSIWLAFFVMLIFALGESLVAPIALSLTSGMSPNAAKSQMTALYFLSMAGGSTLAGRISQLYAPEHEQAFFLSITGGSLVVIAVLVALLKWWQPRTSRQTS